MHLWLINSWIADTTLTFILTDSVDMGASLDLRWMLLINRIMCCELDITLSDCDRHIFVYTTAVTPSYRVHWTLLRAILLGLFGIDLLLSGPPVAQVEAP